MFETENANFSCIYERTLNDEYAVVKFRYLLYVFAFT